MGNATVEMLDRLVSDNRSNPLVSCASDLLVDLLKSKHKVVHEDVTGVRDWMLKHTAFRREYAIFPDWLLDVFSLLLDAKRVDSVLDPWAGPGFLLEHVVHITGARRAVAIGSAGYAANLLRILVPDAELLAGNHKWPPSLVEDRFDLVAGAIPFGVKTDNRMIVNGPNGATTLATNDWGHCLVAAASAVLNEDGVGLFVVPPSFFISSPVRHQLKELGLGLSAAFALPSHVILPTSAVRAFLIVISRSPVSQMFVASLSDNRELNAQVIHNFRDGFNGDSLELGTCVDPSTFSGLDEFKFRKRLADLESSFGAGAVPLGELATSTTLGRPGDEFRFPENGNAIYVPLIGLSNVVDSESDLTLKPQNYVQVVVDPRKADSRFVSRFLNSSFGQDIRRAKQAGVTIPRLTKASLVDLSVIVPERKHQMVMLDLEGDLLSELNTINGLQNELNQLRENLWAKPRFIEDVHTSLAEFKASVSSAYRLHADESLDQWIETLPFPLASILREWQATSPRDNKAKYEHLLHFFEALAEFISMIFISAFRSNPERFGKHWPGLCESLQKQFLSFDRATFGTWKATVEYLGKQTRVLLDGEDKEQNTRVLCTEMFSDSSNRLPAVLCRKEIAHILSQTCKMRNDWAGHGGVVGSDEARLRNEELIAKLQELRGVMGDIWKESKLVQSTGCIRVKGVHENEIRILQGSNSAFLTETSALSICLDSAVLYILRSGEARPLELLPLLHIGPSPESARNACYFYSRKEREGSRFVSYHFADQPERNVPDNELGSLSILWDTD